MPTEGIRVEGLRDLQRAFKRADALLNRELRATLRDVAEPVRADAEQLAVDRIPRIGVPWSRMRIGVTQRLVYIAPRERGKQSRRNPLLKRPNLAGLLYGRAMGPAVDRNEHQIISGFEHLLDTVGRDWEQT